MSKEIPGTSERIFTIFSGIGIELYKGLINPAFI